MSGSYVRQSSPTQVQRHPESARRQYGLTARAQGLGWDAAQITIIDEDQGKSAAGSAAAHERDGFAQVVAVVGLGEVGLILALEVARLARNSADWRSPAWPATRPTGGRPPGPQLGRLEVARLARNSAEWYRLLEGAALAGVLSGDEDTL